MLALNLPPYPYKIKQSGGKLFIFDVLRHKYVFLTPEEWVRQHLVHYLTGHHGYPKALMRTETGLKYNTLYRRSDLLVYDPAGNPFLLAECKDVSVPLTAEVLAQAAALARALPPRQELPLGEDQPIARGAASAQRRAFSTPAS